MHSFIYALQSAFDVVVILIVSCCRTSIHITKRCIILKSVCLHFPHLCIQCNNCSAHLKWPCRLWDWLNVDTCWCWLANIDQSAERWRVKRADILNMVYALLASCHPYSLSPAKQSLRETGQSPQSWSSIWREKKKKRNTPSIRSALPWPHVASVPRQTSIRCAPSP